jgi:hypothetical protein
VVKEAASTIRRLSVQTLDELRHMVSLLRASGGRPTELTPQPTLADVRQLVATSASRPPLSWTYPMTVRRRSSGRSTARSRKH